MTNKHKMSGLKSRLEIWADCGPRSDDFGTAEFDCTIQLLASLVGRHLTEKILPKEPISVEKDMTRAQSKATFHFNGAARGKGTRAMSIFMRPRQSMKP